MSAEPSQSPASTGSTGRSEFGRAAIAIFATMLLLIVALTGILLETTWHQPAGSVEAVSADPGSFAHR